MILSLYFNHFRDICIFSCIVLKICKLPCSVDTANWDGGTKTSLSSSSGHRMTHFHLNQRTAKSPASAERCDVSRLGWAGPGSNILSKHEQHNCYVNINTGPGQRPSLYNTRQIPELISRTLTQGCMLLLHNPRQVSQGGGSGG